MVSLKIPVVEVLRVTILYHLDGYPERMGLTEVF